MPVFLNNSLHSYPPFLEQCGVDGAVLASQDLKEIKESEIKTATFVEVVRLAPPFTDAGKIKQGNRASKCTVRSRS